MHRKRNNAGRRGLVLAALAAAGTLLMDGAAWAATGTVSASVSSSNTGPGVTTASTTSETDSSSEENSNAWKKVNGVYVMSDGSAIDGVIARGIDVSRWQGEITWSQVAADDVSFVMIGTRSSGDVDPYYYSNISGASGAGIAVGAYIYSLATTVEMAQDEADFVLNLIHDYPVSFPIAFDMEDSTMGELSAEELADIAEAFCTRISDAGYYPIIYANENWLNNKLDMSLMDYPVWVARYLALPSYSDPVLWQATSSGAVNGVSTAVDIDFQFEDFSSVIPADTWRTVLGNTYYYKDYVKQKDTWINDGTGWYYMDSDGLVTTGWTEISGESYYLDEETGMMQTGWKEEDGNRYYLSDSGAMAKGWVGDEEGRYFMGADGTMQTGWLSQEDGRYFLGEDGAVTTGWVEADGNWYYMASDGTMMTGWVNDGGLWYYCDSEGVMQTGWLTLDSVTYFLKGSGVMGTGWRQMEGYWYYFAESGAMCTGAVEIDGKTYYFDPETGRMLSDTTIELGGITYVIDAEGVLSEAAASEAEGATEGQELSEAPPQGEATSGQITPSQSGGPGEASSGADTPVTPSDGGPSVQAEDDTLQGTPGYAEGDDVIVIPLG